MASQLLKAITPSISALCESVIYVPGIMSTAGIQLITTVKDIVANGTKQAISDAKLAAIKEVDNITKSVITDISGAVTSLQAGGYSRSYGRVKPCGCRCNKTIRYKRNNVSSRFKKKYTQ
jgi:hypothetical protein